MAVPRGLGKRLQQVLLGAAARRGERLTLADFGALVARRENPPRKTPYSAATVSGWFKEESEPTLSILLAMADISGQHPSFIAFGDLPMANYVPVAAQGRMLSVAETHESAGEYTARKDREEKKAKRRGVK